ncbi:MAG: sulfite exporter TauE/SafE family protein [Pseudorhodoplanes sp.]
MDALHVAILVVAGLFGGILSSMVGGASLVTFPALIAAGVPPMMATATNITALTPGNFLAAITEGRQLKFNGAFVRLVAGSLVGALIGATLLVMTPAQLFERIMPLLLAFATVLFAYGSRISNWLRERSRTMHGREPQMDATSIPILLPASIYTGYFGAGAGVMLLAVFSIWNAGDYRTANATKNFVGSLNGMTAACLFTVQGVVNWKAAFILMIGGTVGGLVGSHLARIAPRKVIQVAVVLVGVTLTIIYAWRYWF